MSSGAEASIVISEGYVIVTGEVETRKRKKLRKGDIVLFENVQINVFWLYDFFVFFFLIVCMHIKFLHI